MKKSGGRGVREVVVPQEHPDIFFPDISDITDIPDVSGTSENLPGPPMDFTVPMAADPVKQTGLVKGGGRGARRGARAKSAGPPFRSDNIAAPERQEPVLGELFNGEKLPLAIISAVVLSPPRARQGLRKNI